MTNSQLNHGIIAVMINLAVIALLVKKTWDGNDKAIILLIFFYPLLIFVNGLVWMAMSSRRKAESKVYRGITVGLLILFLPVLLIASSN